MERYEKIGSGIISVRGFLKRRFVGIVISYIKYINAAILEYLANGHCKAEYIILFLSSVIYGTGVTAAMAGINCNFILSHYILHSGQLFRQLHVKFYILLLSYAIHHTFVHIVALDYIIWKWYRIWMQLTVIMQQTAGFFR